jgi:hypothetical protein
LVLTRNPRHVFVNLLHGSGIANPRLVTSPNLLASGPVVRFFCCGVAERSSSFLRPCTRVRTSKPIARCPRVGIRSRSKRPSVNVVARTTQGKLLQASYHTLVLCLLQRNAAVAKHSGRERICVLLHRLRRTHELCLHIV